MEWCSKNSCVELRPIPEMSRPSILRNTALQASLMEIAQIAEADAGLIWGTAAISAACVMVGIAIGFVLLRLESLVEDGTIKL